MIISRKAIDLIVHFEVTSEAVYTAKYTGLEWPGGASGVTIGIGYDLGYSTPASIEADWKKEVGLQTCNVLKTFAGLKGSKAASAVANNKAKIVIPYASAYNVFIKKIISKYGALALKTYPGLDKLGPDAAGAIVSLVYNRGASLEGSSRVEMAAIKTLVIAKDYKGIAEQLRSMKRLWTVAGLKRRRDAEADLVIGSVRVYDRLELVEI